MPLATGHWDTALTALSVTVSIFTALVALRVLENGRGAATSSARRHWLAAAALVFGGGISAKYIVGLLAFSPDAPARYAVAPTVGAFILSVVVAGGGFAMLGMARGFGPRSGAATLVVIGILAALRLDMAAIRLEPALAMDMGQFGYAAVVAVAIAAALAWLTARPHPTGVLVLGAVAVGAGVCGTHWLGMKAVGLQGPLMFRDDSEAMPSGVISPDVLATLVAVFALTLLAIVFVSVAVDRRRAIGLHEANEVLEARVRQRTCELERNAGALVLARDEAERAVKARDQLLANMSHEFRTPLNAVLGFSEMMRNEFQGALDNPHYKTYVDMIHKSGTHLLGLVNQLLDLSRMEAGRFALAAETVDLGALARECAALVSPAAAEKQVALRTEGAPRVLVDGADAAALRQVLLNLISNAVKFTDAGGAVAVQVRDADGTVEVTVADNGIGIPEAALKRVLEPFQQADPSVSRKYGGAGLGLAISNRLMGLMGGSLDLVSSVGRGTTATIRLPAAVESPSRVS
ncbi:MAG: ATP-binding protein [Alphaproteobacteria bacterium]